jgi:hypothetical protein
MTPQEYEWQCEQIDMFEVNAVAKAICKSRTCEGVACCQWPGNMGRTDCPVKRGGYDDAAIAAIEAVLKFSVEN